MINSSWPQHQAALVFSIGILASIALFVAIGVLSVALFVGKSLMGSHHAANKSWPTTTSHTPNRRS